MGITFESLAARHPQLVHHAANGVDAGLLVERGLLSVSALLEALAEDDGHVRWRAVGEERWRASPWRELNRRERGVHQVEVEGRGGRRAVLNDQRPLLGLDALQARGGLLDGLTPGDWVEVLNSRVYFWADARMREDFKAKYDRGGLRTIVLTTARMPAALRSRIRVSRINGGAINGVAQRGPSTYATLPSATFDLSEVKEITIETGVTAAELRACGAGAYIKRALGDDSTEVTVSERMRPLPFGKRTLID